MVAQKLKILGILIFLITAVSNARGETQDFRRMTDIFQQEHEGYKREVLVYAPLSVRLSKKKVPVVIMFHGSSGTGEKFWNISGWKEKAKQEGFIAVFPTGQKYWICEEGKPRRFITKWGYPKIEKDFCSDVEQTVANDLIFFDNLLENIEKNYPVDKKKLYISGFSNGAGFSNYLLINRSKKIAAAAAHGGGSALTESPQFSKPFFTSIGSKDDRVLSNLPYEQLPTDETFLDLPEFNAIYLNNLNKLGISEDAEIKIHDTPLMISFLSVEKRKFFSMSVVKNNGHQYPNGKNHPLVMADVLWKFFSNVK